MRALPPAALVEAASWALARDLTRRHPELSILKYHPGGGQYDCLAIRSASGLHIDLNRVGRIHVHADHTGDSVRTEPVEWNDYLEADPREFVERLERIVGLPHVTSIPVTTPRVLTYRVLAAFSHLHAFGRHADISMSTLDSSGGMGGGPAAWPSDYPTVIRAMDADPFGFWRATSTTTELVLETEAATLHRQDGSTASLPGIYATHERDFGRLFGHLLAGI